MSAPHGVASTTTPALFAGMSLTAGQSNTATTVATGATPAVSASGAADVLDLSSFDFVGDSQASSGFDFMGGQTSPNDSQQPQSAQYIVPAPAAAETSGAFDFMNPSQPVIIDPAAAPLGARPAQTEATLAGAPVIDPFADLMEAREVEEVTTCDHAFSSVF